MTAQARHSDPQTSHDAAQQAEVTGLASAQRQVCWAVVKKNPGSTAAEVAVLAKLERHVPSRRLPELRADSLVHNGEPRICTATGNRSLTWFPGAAPAVPTEMFQQELPF